MAVKPMKPEDVLQVRRRRARQRHLRAHHDHLAGVADHRARRSLGRLRGLHGRRLVAWGSGWRSPVPDRRVIVFDGDGSLLMQLGSLATIAGAAPRNFTHLLFKNGVYHTSGSQEIPGGLTVDFVADGEGAGYRERAVHRQLEDLKRRLPELLNAEGPVFVELHTGLADQTPMTARGGVPFPQQVESLRVRLVGPARLPRPRGPRPGYRGRRALSARASPASTASAGT